MEKSPSSRMRRNADTGGKDGRNNDKNNTKDIDVLNDSSFNYTTQKIQNNENFIDLLDDKSCAFTGQVDETKELNDKTVNLLSETDDSINVKNTESDQPMEIEQFGESEQSIDASQPVQTNENGAVNKSDVIVPKTHKRAPPQDFEYENPAVDNYFQKRLLQTILLLGGTKEILGEWEIDISRRQTGLAAGILKVMYRSNKPSRILKSRSEIIWCLGILIVGNNLDKGEISHLTGYFLAVERRERNLLSLQLELSKDQCANVIYSSDCIKIIKPQKLSNTQKEVNEDEHGVHMDTREAATVACEEVDDAQEVATEVQQETNDVQLEADAQQTKGRAIRSVKPSGLLYNRWARKRFLYDFPELGKRRDSYKSNIIAPPGDSPQPSSEPNSQQNSQKLSTNDIIIHIHGNYGILNWGNINHNIGGNEKINYHSSNEIYPIGFKCVIIERDVICNKIVTLLLEILEVDIGSDSINHYCNQVDYKKKVQFKITAVWNYSIYTDERAVYLGDTPADVWKAVMNEKKYIPEKRLAVYERLLAHNNSLVDNSSASVDIVKNVTDSSMQSDITNGPLDSENMPGEVTASNMPGEVKALPGTEESTTDQPKYIFRRFYIDYVDQNLLVHSGVMRLIEGMASSLDCKKFVFKQHEGDYSNLLKEFQALQTYVKLLEKVGARITYVGEYYPIVPLVPFCPLNQSNTKQSSTKQSSSANQTKALNSNRPVAKEVSASKSSTTAGLSNGNSESSDKSQTGSNGALSSSSNNPKPKRNVAPSGVNNSDNEVHKAFDKDAMAKYNLIVAEREAARKAIQAANEQTMRQYYKVQIANQKVKDIQMKLKGFFSATHNKYLRQLQKTYATIDRFHETEFNHMHVYSGLRDNAHEAKSSIPLPVVISNSAACPAHVIDKVIQIYLFLTSYKFYNQNNIHAIESIPPIDRLIDLVVNSYTANSRSPDIEIIPSAASAVTPDSGGLLGGYVGTNTILQIFEKICMALAVPLIPKFEKHVGIAASTATNEDDRLKIPINIYTWREIIRIVLLGEACEIFGQAVRDEKIELLVKGGYDDCFHEIEFMEKKMVKYARKKVLANYNSTSSILLDIPVVTRKYNSWLELLGTVNDLVDPYQIYNTIASSIMLIDKKHQTIIEILNTSISPAVFNVQDCSLTKQMVVKVVQHFSGVIGNDEPNVSIYDLYCRKEANSMMINSKRFLSTEDIIDTAMDLDNEVEVEEKIADVNDEAVQALPVPLKRCYEVLTYLIRHPLGRNIMKKIYKTSTLCARYNNFKMTFDDVKNNILTSAYRNPDSYVTDFYVDVYSIFDHLYYFTSPEGSINHDLIVKLSNLFIQLIRSHVLCTHTANPIINSYCLVCHEYFNSVDDKKNLYCERCGGSHHASCVYYKAPNAKKSGKEKEDWYCNVCTTSNKKSFTFSTHPYRKATVRHPSKGEVYGQIINISYLNTILKFIVEFSDESSFVWSIETVVKYLVRSFHSLPIGMSHLDYNRVISLIYGCDSSTYIPLPMSLHSNLSSLMVGSHTAQRVQMELFEKAQVALGVHGDYNSFGSDTVDGYINIILSIISVLLQFPNAVAEFSSQNMMYDQKISECAQIIHKKDKDTLFSDRFFLDSPELKTCMTKSVDDIVQNVFRLASDKECDAIYIDGDYIDGADDKKGNVEPEDSHAQAMDTSCNVEDDNDSIETASQGISDSDDSFILQINEECTDFKRLIDLTEDGDVDSKKGTNREQLDAVSQQLLNQYLSRKNGIETALSTQNILLELFSADNVHAVLHEIREVLEKSLYHFTKAGGQVETIQLELPADYLPSSDGYSPQVSTELVNFIMQQIVPINESIHKLDNEEWFSGFDSVMTIFESNNYSSGAEVCCICNEGECSSVSPLIFGETYDEWLRFEYSTRNTLDSHPKPYRVWIPFNESYRCDIHDPGNSCYDNDDDNEINLIWDLRDGSLLCHERCMEYLHNKRLKAFRETQRHHLIEFIETYTRVNFNSSRLIPFGVDHNSNMYFYINGSTSLYVYCSSVSFGDKAFDRKDPIESKLQKGFANYITPEYTSAANNHMYWFIYEHLGDIGRIIQYLRSFCVISASNRKLEKILSWLYPHAMGVADEESGRYDQLCKQQLRQANAVVHSDSNTSILPGFTTTLPKHVIASSAQSSEESSNAQWNNAYRFLALPSYVVQLNASPRVVELINFDSSSTLIFLIECVRHLYEKPECPMRSVKLVLMVIFKALPTAAFDLSIDDTWQNINMFQESFIRGVYHASSASVLANFLLIFETALKPAYVNDETHILNTLPCRTRLLYQPIYSSLLYRLFCLDQVLKYKST